MPGTPVYKIGELHTIFYLCFLVLLVYFSVFVLESFTKNTKKVSALFLLAAVTMGTYKSNKPCDYTSYDGELCPWHGLPGKKPDLWFKAAPKHPHTWEDVKEVIEESKSNQEDITTTLINSSELDFDNCSLSEVIKFLQRMAKYPHTSSLNIALPSISLMLLSKLGRRNLS